jgi:hypothetical protein
MDSEAIRPAEHCCGSFVDPAHASRSAMRYAFGGSICVILLVLVYAQITSGTSFPIVKFRASQPGAFWTVVGAYGLLFIIFALGFLARQ